MNHNQRVALFIPALHGGGAERVILNLAGSLADQGYDVDLILGGAVGEYVSQIPKNVRVVDMNVRVADTARLVFWSLVRYLRKERPVALVSAMEPANIVAILAKRFSGVSTRVVITIHNTLSIQIQPSKSRRDQFIYFCIKNFYRLADNIVTVSSGVADDLSKLSGIPRKRINVVYNPISAAEIAVKAQQPIEHPWFAEGQPPVLLSVGRLNKQKDYPTLLQALAKVREQRDVRLMILGDGKERANLEALVKTLGLTESVAMPGFVENPFAYMAKARLFVLSSQFEGFGNVLVEAMACGTPVVSTDCPNGPSEILANGKYGQLANVSDPDSLAKAILTSLNYQRTAPPREAFTPYETATITAQYTQILFPADQATPIGLRLQEQQETL